MVGKMNQNQTYLLTRCACIKTVYCFLVFSLTVFTAYSVAEPVVDAPRTLVFALPNSNVDPMSAFEVRLLQAALAHSNKKFVLQPAAQAMVQSRALKELTQSQQINVFWSMTSEAREKNISANSYSY